MLAARIGQVDHQPRQVPVAARRWLPVSATCTIAVSYSARNPMHPELPALLESGVAPLVELTPFSFTTHRKSR
jgi:hypothetical protein